MFENNTIKKRIKKIFITSLITFVCFTNISFAQNSADILANLEKQYSQLNFINAKFTQNKTVKFISKPLISKGELWAAKKYGFIWQINTPFKNKMLVNNSGVYKFDEQGNKNKVDDIQMKVIADIFMKIFSGSFSEIEDDFDIVAKQTNQGWALELKPSSFIVKKSIFKIEIFGDKNPEKMKIVDVNKNISEISFTKIISKKIISKNEKKLFK